MVIQTFKNADDGTHSLDRTLAELDPGFVIMYHSNITAIRQIEVFEAERQRPIHKRLQVFFLMHSQTVEEQSYLTSLRREKQAFDLLIETKRVIYLKESFDFMLNKYFTINYRQWLCLNIKTEKPICCSN